MNLEEAYVSKSKWSLHIVFRFDFFVGFVFAELDNE